MGFQPVESTPQVRCNTVTSGEFLSLYERALDENILAGELRLPSRTFAPSQIRCKRVSWFRLRGVTPEPETEVDRVLNFTTQVGTACHQTIQGILSNKLGNNWIDPETYLKQTDLPYQYICTKNGFETLIEISKPVPIKFAPDGIFFWQDKYWLLEIKTSEHSSFEKLTAVKSQHLDQIKCYATLLNIHNVLVIYQDRAFGGLKCFEVIITDADMKQIWNMFREVQDCVAKNIAPNKPEDTRYCNPSYCRYYNKCKEW